MCIVYACCAWHQALRCIVWCAAWFCVSALSGVVAYYLVVCSYLVPYVVVRCVLFVVRSPSYWSTASSPTIFSGAIRSVFMVYYSTPSTSYGELQFLCSVLSMVQYAYGMVAYGMIWRGLWCRVRSTRYCLFTEWYSSTVTVLHVKGGLLRTVATRMTNDAKCVRVLYRSCACESDP